MPKTVAPLTSEEFEETVFPERAALGASFFNKWRIKEQELNPDVQGELEFGYRYDLDNGMALGITGAGKYNNEWQRARRQRRDDEGWILVANRAPDCRAATLFFDQISGTGN